MPGDISKKYHRTASSEIRAGYGKDVAPVRLNNEKVKVVGNGEPPSSMGSVRGKRLSESELKSK